MILGIPKEILDNELRVAALPETVAEYVKMGFEVLVQASAGEGALRADAEYEASGARIVRDPQALFAAADVIVKVKQPWFNKETGKHEVEMMRPGAVLVTFLHPAAPPNHDTVRMLAARNVTALTMDDIPRISRAQMMDALTSMSTVTGYKSVLIAANKFPKFIPLIGTAIGTIKAARFLIVGTGEVGRMILQKMQQTPPRQRSPLRCPVRRSRCRHCRQVPCGCSPHGKWRRQRGKDRIWREDDRSQGRCGHCS